MPVAAAAGMCYHGIVSQDTQQAKVHMGGETMKKIVILGAGKIGRGFVADAFAAGGYKLVFADADAALVKALRDRGHYTLRNVRSADEQETKVIGDYEALHIDDERLVPEIIEAGLAAVAIFPNDFPGAAKIIAEALTSKHARGDASALDVLVIANLANAQRIFADAVRQALPAQLHEFMEKTLGVCATVAARVAVRPTGRMLDEDPLAVLTDGCDVLPVERKFKGECPACPMLEYHDSLDALAARKLYTCNMAHAASAYLGASKGCATICEALNDAQIEQIVRGALDEALEGFVREGTFAAEDKAACIDGVIRKFQNPVIGDTPARVGADPRRKLRGEGCIVGAMRMARNNGVYPYYLSKIAAYGLLFAQPGDEGAAEVRAFAMQNGVEAAVRKYMELWEPDLIYAVKRHYLKADGRFVAEDARRVRFLRRAYETGFCSEKQYRGCAQGTLIALETLTGIGNKDLFRAATGMSGGMALCGDGVCGGYSGGLLFMSYIKGRDLDRIAIDGDKVNQYIAYDAAQRLHDHFIACFGSPVCMRIHEGMFRGEHYILRTKARRNEFEDAGAHTIVCTTVVALAASWVAEIILDMGLYELKED